MQWKPGQKVFAAVGELFGKSGTYAEYFAANADHLATLPSTLPFKEAGGVPLAALTAYQVPCHY